MTPSGETEVTNKTDVLTTSPPRTRDATATGKRPPDSRPPPLDRGPAGVTSRSEERPEPRDLGTADTSAHDDAIVRPEQTATATSALCATLTRTHPLLREATAGPKPVDHLRSPRARPDHMHHAVRSGTATEPRRGTRTSRNRGLASPERCLGRWRTQPATPARPTDTSPLRRRHHCAPPHDHVHPVFPPNARDRDRDPMAAPCVTTGGADHGEALHR